MHNEDHASAASAEACQRRLLQGVSRTFAVSIPQFPPALARVVGNAYLLCRIVDTIEDEPALPVERKREFSRRFARLVAGEKAGEAEDFAAALLPLLRHASADERDLVRHTPLVLGITHGLTTPQRRALARCVGIMAEGMVRFQEADDGSGLADMAALDDYCYCVAGVVGEMLTELFCDYSGVIARRRAPLMRLAVSFGQGLQMTNILKDFWEDHRRRACWLPRAEFLRAGCDPTRRVRTGAEGDAYRRLLRQLVGVAAGHLHRALDYTLLIPAEQRGIRVHCLLNLGMAVLTLRNIERRPGFDRAAEVKISRATVRILLKLTPMLAGQDRLLRLLFAWATRALPRPEVIQGGPTGQVHTGTTPPPEISRLGGA